MMQTDRPTSTTSTDAHAAGWIASLLLHGTLAFGVFVFMQQITTRAQPVSFTWNVAMVTPPSPATAASAQRSVSPTPASKPAVKSALAKPMTPAQPVEPLTPTLDAREPSPLIPSPAAEHPPVSRTTDIMEHDSVQADRTPQTPVLSAPVQSIASVSADSGPSTHDESTGGHKDPLPLQQAALSTEPQTVTLGPAGQAKSVNPDFGWLNDDIERWYEHFNKFYPPELRLEGTSGRVKLRMFLGKDGVVSDIRITESSGNPQLDQAAIEIISKAPPIKLSRPLGQARKLIGFWYRFNLVR